MCFWYTKAWPPHTASPKRTCESDARRTPFLRGRHRTGGAGAPHYVAYAKTSQKRLLARSLGASPGHEKCEFMPLPQPF